MNTIDTIKAAAAEEFEVEAEKIDIDAPFDQLGIDSLALVEFIFALEDRFEVRLAADKARDMRTLRELAGLIDEARTATANAPASAAAAQ